MDAMKILIYILIGLEAVVAVLIGIAVIKEAAKERRGKKAKETESVNVSVQEPPTAEEPPAIAEKKISETPAAQPTAHSEAKTTAHEDKSISSSRERRRLRFRIVKSDDSAKNTNRISVDDRGDCSLDEKLVRIRKDKTPQVIDKSVKTKKKKVSIAGENPAKT